MTVAPRFLFLADAGQRVGGGHVLRCLTLAGALTRKGALCAFAATPAAAAILDVFGADMERLAVPEASAPGLAASAAQAGLAWGAQAAVIDHYGAGLAEEALVREAVGPLLVIDDLRREHRCELVLDSNLSRSAKDYPGAESLVGPGFALVRPEFTQRRERTLARRAAGRAAERAFVGLGLTDVGGVTGWVVSALLAELGDCALDVAVGADAASLPELRAWAVLDPRLHLHADTREMAELMAAADVAVGAGGSSVWERCCLGLPSVTIVLADNQRDNTAALAAAGATLALDAHALDFGAQLAAEFRRLCADAALRADISVAAAALCDGQGAERVAERLLAVVNA